MRGGMRGVASRAMFLCCVGCGAPADDSIAELEHGLQITEEVLRHLVTRDERPVKTSRRDDGGEDAEEGEERELPSGVDEEDEDDGTERIDESESEAAPAAID